MAKRCSQNCERCNGVPYADSKGRSCYDKFMARRGVLPPITGPQKFSGRYNQNKVEGGVETVSYEAGMGTKIKPKEFYTEDDIKHWKETGIF